MSIFTNFIEKLKSIIPSSEPIQVVGTGAGSSKPEISLPTGEKFKVEDSQTAHNVRTVNDAVWRMPPKESLFNKAKNKLFGPSRNELESTALKQDVSKEYPISESFTKTLYDAPVTMSTPDIDSVLGLKRHVSSKINPDVKNDERSIDDIYGGANMGIQFPLANFLDKVSPIIMDKIPEYLKTNVLNVQSNPNIELTTFRASTLLHEVLHTAWVENIRNLTRGMYNEDVDKGASLLIDNFNKDWDKSIKNNKVLENIDQMLFTNKTNYEGITDFPDMLANERYAHLGSSIGQGGIEAFPPSLKKYYKSVFLPSSAVETSTTENVNSTPVVQQSLSQITENHNDNFFKQFDWKNMKSSELLVSQDLSDYSSQIDTIARTIYAEAANGSPIEKLMILGSMQNRAKKAGDLSIENVYNVAKDPKQYNGFDSMMYNQAGVPNKLTYLSQQSLADSYYVLNTVMGGGDPELDENLRNIYTNAYYTHAAYDDKGQLRNRPSLESKLKYLKSSKFLGQVGKHYFWSQ